MQNRINVLNAFQASGEFSALTSTLYGSATSDNQRTESFVNNFYLGAYGRNATSTELQQQRDALNTAAGQGLSQVQSQAEAMGRSLFASQVTDYSITDQQFVTNLYEGFLQRGPDAGGLSFWTGQAAGGSQNRQNVLNSFATCSASRELSGRLYRETFWLVGDHLNTPRMVVDKSGSLVGVKRHDYLPFGEELYAGTGGRTVQQGYNPGDNVRQKFASKEQDNETGLDYFEARYFSAVQGRFTSTDNFLNDTSAVDPASWNLYVYVRDNPLRYTDPSGEMIYVGNLSPADLAELIRRLNYTYGNCNCISVDKDGYLQVDTSGLSTQLAAATQFLTEAIRSTTYFAEVQVSNDDSDVAFGENRQRQGGVTYKGVRTNADLIVLDFGDDRHVSGDRDAKEAFLNTVFAHEVAHGYLGLHDPKAGDIGKTGAVVDAINKITDALGVPHRDAYFSTGRGGFWLTTPFSKQEVKNGKPVVDKLGKPKMKEVYVNWLKRNVGGKGIN